MGELPLGLEPMLAPQEIAQAWHLDPATVRKMFQDEDGVLRLGKSNRRDGKRDYVTLRIPLSVAQRVAQQRTR